MVNTQVVTWFWVFSLVFVISLSLKNFSRLAIPPLRLLLSSPAPPGPTAAAVAQGGAGGPPSGPSAGEGQEHEVSNEDYSHRVVIGEPLISKLF